MFCFVTPFIIGFLILLFYNIFDGERRKENKLLYRNEIIETVLMIVLFGLPYLYVFNVLPTATAVIIFVIYFFVLGMAMAFLKKSKVES